MKDFSLLIWLTQLGLSVTVPLLGFILLAVWLRDALGWGNWVIWVGIVLGIYSAIHGLISALKTLRRLTDDPEKEAPPVAFNDHS